MNDVMVTFPARVWGRLANLADDRGVKVPDLIAAAVAEMVPVTREERVLLLVRAGLSDGDVAARTGETRAYVARHRLKAGIRRRESK